MSKLNHNLKNPFSDKYNGPKRALILAGGGMRVAYQAGVLRALFESGYRFEHVDGTSGGIINTAMMFSDLSADEMCNRWETLNVKDFVSYMPLFDYVKPFDLKAMGDADGIVNKVFPHLGIDVKKINKVKGMTGSFNVCNYTNKTNEVIPHDKIDLDLLVAGISLPIFMPPVKKGKYLYMDSVWIKDANLMEGVKRGAEELWVIWCIGNSDEYKDGLFNQYVHMIELSANGGLFEEFERIREINERISNGEIVYGHTAPIKLHLIKPEHPLPLDPELYFGHINTATLIGMGYSDAKQYLKTMSKNGLPFESSVTKMKEAEIGVTFREKMIGGFALGVTDPKEGMKKGKAEGTKLSLNVSIIVHDLRKFISNVKHTGLIFGNIDFSAFGGKILAKSGKFNLFSPTDDADLKVLVYELCFEYNGDDYFLSGKKMIKDDPGFDLWKDTTTLFTHMHRGSDKTGTIIGAGILELKPRELMKLISSMHITNAGSTKEKIKATREFGQFFMGEFWDSYAKKLKK